MSSAESGGSVSQVTCDALPTTEALLPRQVPKQCREHDVSLSRLLGLAEPIWRMGSYHVPCYLLHLPWGANDWFESPGERLSAYLEAWVSGVIGKPPLCLGELQPQHVTVPEVSPLASHN